MKRANFLPAPHYFNLNMACLPITEAFGYRVYLVGSAMTRRDYRDVDVRCILSDDDYAHLFPRGPLAPQADALWSILCASISLYLSQHSGLPVDFQFQQQSKANVENTGPRSALGLFVPGSDLLTEGTAP